MPQSSRAVEQSRIASATRATGLTVGCAATRPGTAVLALDVPAVQEVGDLLLKFPLLDECPVHPAHRLDLHRNSRHEDDSVGLDALMFTPGQLALILRASFWSTSIRRRP